VRIIADPLHSARIVFDLRGQPMTPPEIELHYANSVAGLAAVEPLWNALQAHHSQIAPSLAGGASARHPQDAWERRRKKYEGWLTQPETFFVIARERNQPIGYAFVTVGPSYASWDTGGRLAELETLSVLPERRGSGVGEALLEAVWRRLAQLEVNDLAITAAIANVDAHRFYERHGFTQSFVIYYGRRPGPSLQDAW
jgi:GNAT superfamily N-acetyltransferase